MTLLHIFGRRAIGSPGLIKHSLWAAFILRWLRKIVYHHGRQIQSLPPSVFHCGGRNNTTLPYNSYLLFALNVLDYFKKQAKERQGSRTDLKTNLPQKIEESRKTDGEAKEQAGKLVGVRKVRIQAHHIYLYLLILTFTYISISFEESPTHIPTLFNVLAKLLLKFNEKMLLNGASRLQIR